MYTSAASPREHCALPTSAAGALCALGLGQYTQDTQTALLGSRWPTAKAGATYASLLVVFVLLPGLLTIWVSLLLLKQRGTAKGGHSSYSQHLHGVKGEATTAAAAATEAGSAGSGPQAALSAVSAAAVGAVTSGSTGRLLAAADGSLQLQLPVMPKQQAMPTGSSSAQEAPRLGAAQPEAAAAGAAGGVCLTPVECGRPQLEHLTKAWLATQQQQLTVHRQHSRHTVLVYAMGPERLVQQVQQLCDGVGSLCFVRKTQPL